MKSLFSEPYLFLHKIFCGTKDFPSVLSFNGVLNRRMAWATALIIYFLLQCISWCNIPMLTYISGLLMFYCVLALVQKRCRDFGSKGTFPILYITVAMLIISTLYYLGDVENIPINNNLQQTGKIAYCLIAFLFFIPSKAGTDKNLRSPLLKYPFLYTAFCWAMAIGTSLWAKYYFLPE